MMNKTKKWGSKQDAHNSRKHSWACLHCYSIYHSKVKFCETCGKDVQYFASKDELKRFNQLRLLKIADKIENLRSQVPYPISINQKQVFVYRADFVYTISATGEEVVEDVKGTLNPKYWDPVFKIKKKCVEAFYGFEIKIVKP